MVMILMLNLKGGVAKTATTISIAEQWAEQGKRVLVIDADHQYTASELLLGEERFMAIETRKRTLHDLLASMIDESFSIDDIEKYVARESTTIRSIQPQVDCIPCSYRIDEFVTNVAKARRGYQNNEFFLTRWKRIRTLMSRWCHRNYDYTLIDCPPSLALQVRFFLGCSDYYLSPCIPDRLSVRGTSYLCERIRKMGFRHIQPLGLLWSMVRIQVRAHTEMIATVEQGTSDYEQLPPAFHTTIPNTSAMANAMHMTKSVATYRDKYRGDLPKLFSDVSREMSNRINRI